MHGKNLNTMACILVRVFHSCDVEQRRRVFGGPTAFRFHRLDGGVSDRKLVTGIAADGVAPSRRRPAVHAPGIDRPLASSSLRWGRRHRPPLPSAAPSTGTCAGQEDGEAASMTDRTRAAAAMARDAPAWEGRP